MARFPSTWRWVVCLFVTVGVAVAIVAASVAATRDWIAPPTRDFPLTGGDYWHRRYSALDQGFR